MNFQRKNSQWPLTLPPWFQENRDEIFWIINYPCTPLEFFHSGNSSVLADTTVPNTATKLLEQKHLNCGAYLCLQDTILENRSVMGKYDRNCWGQKCFHLFLFVVQKQINCSNSCYFLHTCTSRAICDDDNMLRWWLFNRGRDSTQGKRDEIRFVTSKAYVMMLSLGPLKLTISG